VSELVQAISAIGLIATNIIGFRAARKAQERDKAELIAAMANKIDVAEYRAKTKELHDVNNAQNLEITEMKTEMRNLKRLVRLLSRRRGQR
jgi:hypothetical protein